MKWYDVCNKISLLLHAFFSAVGYFLIEAISRHSLPEACLSYRSMPLTKSRRGGSGHFREVESEER